MIRYAFSIRAYRAALNFLVHVKISTTSSILGVYSQDHLYCFYKVSTEPSSSTSYTGP